MHDLKLDLLDHPPTYLGEGISLRGLEEAIHAERALQNEQVEELAALRARNDQTQRALSEEMNRLREISEHLSRNQNRGGLGSSLREIFGRLPWFQGRVITRNSIEQLLRGQYELSARRLKEAAEFADRLEVARANLYDEIERLNARIIVSAQNEELATAYLEELRELARELERRWRAAPAGSARQREIRARIDQCKRLSSEHTSLLRLYGTAEERLDKLKENTHQLAETIAYLRSDINLYVTAASEKLDVIAGQIQALGAAADAAVVMLELKHSLEAMTEAVNHTSRFVSETQAYFRQNVDQMVDELNLYDEETVLVFDQNLTFNEVVDGMKVDDLMNDSLALQIAQVAARAEVEATQVEAEEPQAARATQAANRQ